MPGPEKKPESGMKKISRKCEIAVMTGYFTDFFVGIRYI